MLKWSEVRKQNATSHIFLCQPYKLGFWFRIWIVNTGQKLAVNDGKFRESADYAVILSVLAGLVSIISVSVWRIQIKIRVQLFLSKQIRSWILLL